MFTEPIFNGITIVSIFVSALLAVFFSFTHSGRRFDNLLLASLLVIFASQIFYSYSISNYECMYFMAWHKPLFLLKQVSLLMGPIMYLYLRSLTAHDVEPGPRLLLHALPCVGMVTILSFVLPGIDGFILWASPFDLYSTLLILAQSLGYIGLATMRLRSLEGGLGGFVQSFRVASHATWLRFLLLGFVTLWFVKLNSFATYMILERPGWCAYTGSIFALVAFLGMVVMILLVLLKPDMFYVLAKYRTSSLDEEAKRTLRRLVESHMQDHKPYLNANVTLRMIARDLGLQQRALSQVINEGHGKSFKGYLADYRIREAMRLFGDPANDERTILEILYEVGFNSKSVFNAQFKRHTGLTPVEYRARLKSRQAVPTPPREESSGSGLEDDDK